MKHNNPFKMIGPWVGLFLLGIIFGGLVVMEYQDRVIQGINQGPIFPNHQLTKDQVCSVLNKAQANYDTTCNFYFGQYTADKAFNSKYENLLFWPTTIVSPDTAVGLGGALLSLLSYLTSGFLLGWGIQYKFFNERR
jgi:hypothetical protein